MHYGYNTGDLSEDEVSDLPSCAFASRASNSNIQHHYLTSLHHSSDNGPCGSSGSNLSSSDFYGSSPYRVQRHAANIRERKRMLRSAIGPTGYSTSCSIYVF